MTTPADSAAGVPGAIRLARYLAAGGVASRRACEDLIRAGVVSVNGTAVLTPAVNVIPGRDQVCCRGQPVRSQTLVCLVLNKPVGYTCSARDEHARHLVYELIPARFGRLFTVGRLDRDSEGLIVLTNDGDLAQLLAHPSRGVRKVYRVDVRGRLDEDCLARLRTGVLDDDGDFLRPAAAEVLGHGAAGGTLRLVLQEGRKREIRRLCAAVGLRVQRLQRVAFGPLRLGTLGVGAWRELAEAEVTALRRAARTPRPGGGPDAGQRGGRGLCVGLD